MKKTLYILILLYAAPLTGCGGGGGGASTSGGGGAPQSGDAWPIYAALSVGGSSYANKNDTRLERTQIEKFASNVNPISVTFGDFFQDGQFSAFIVLATPGQLGEVRFLRWKGSESRWVDDSDRILSRANNNSSACVNSQYAITADFNLDGKPDVYLSCAKTTQAVAQVLFLSQPNGTYIRQMSDFVVDGKSASALDINADGYIDLIVSNSTSVSSGEPEVYLGSLVNGQPSFPSRPTTGKLVMRDPSHLCTGGNVGSAIPSFVNYVGAVPSTNGRTDLILGASGALNSIIWLKDLGASSSPRYSICKSAFFQNVTDSAVLTDVYSSVDSGVAYFYLARKTSTQSMSITRYTLDEVAVNNNTSTNYAVVKGNQSAWVTGTASEGVPELFKVTSGYFRAFDAGCIVARCNVMSVAVATVH